MKKEDPGSPDAGVIAEPEVDGPCAATLLGYTPRSLSANEWQLTRIVSIRAVCATEPLNDHCAVNDLSMLCAFLSYLPDWDHQTEPDLRSLITERTIAQHEDRLSARGLSDSSRNKARAVLRRVARVLHGGQPRIHSKDRRWGTAYILDPDQLGDLVRHASIPPPHGHEALALCAQIGAGLPAQAAAALKPEQLDRFGGTIRLGKSTLAVLADLRPFLLAAHADLRRGSAATPESLLPDCLARPVWLLTHLQVGTPISVLNDASRRATGASLQRHEFERLVPLVHRPELDGIETNVSPAWWGTVRPDLLAAVRALTATLTATGPEVPEPVPTTSQTPKRPRKLSRAAALRAAKAAQAEGQTRHDPVYLSSDLNELPGYAALPAEVRKQITNYRPQRVAAKEWTAIEPIARRLMVLRLVVRQGEDAPTTRRKVNVIGSHLAPYLVWARHHLEHQSLAELAMVILEQTSLDRYTNEAMLDEPKGTVATRRSEVRGALIAARPGPKPKKLPYRPVSPPYLAAEAVYHVRLAKNQPTASRRRGIAFILAAGYGAGLDGRDMASVRACDIFTVELPAGERAVLIRVGGVRPRTVVVRHEYQELLLYALQLHTEEHRGRRGLMLGRKPGRRNVTTPALERLVTADGRDIVIDVPRLRSTWLVAHMSAAVPLGTLLSAAGLRSVRALTDLLPYTTVPDDAACVELMRGRPGLLPITPSEDPAA